MVPRGDLDTIWTQIFFFFFFFLILQEFCDLGLTLFDIPNDVVFAEILVLSNIFGFLVVNWAPGWTKTVNFRCVLFENKYE